MKKSGIASAIGSVVLGALGILLLEAYRGAMPLAYGQSMAFSTYLLLLFAMIGMLALAVGGALAAGRD